MGYVGNKRAVGAVKRRGTEGVGEARLPAATGPPLGPPIFAGIDMFYLRPVDLVGTIALGDPITDLPAQGGLITGSFSASGTARPILQDDGTGRIGAYFDGTDDRMILSGLSLDLSGGFTLCFVARKTTNTGLSGVLRGDAGSDVGNQSYFDTFRYSGREYVTTRRNTGSIQQTASTIRITAGTIQSSLYHTGTAAGSGAGGAKIYADGVDVSNVYPTASSRPSSGITRLNFGRGFDANWHGTIYEVALYNAELDAVQRESVRDYLRDEWNGGSPF